MVNVMHAIIKFQPEWFAGNMDFLRPLRLQEIANYIKKWIFQLLVGQLEVNL